MSEDYSSITWPAVIQLKSDDELIFVKDEQHFLSDTDIQITLLQDEDRLIDSNGEVYNLRKNLKLEIIPSKTTISLNEAKGLLQNHLSSLGTCCVAKFDAHSIKEAFRHVFEEYY
jgi:hypothetical protein